MKKNVSAILNILIIVVTLILLVIIDAWVIPAGGFPYMLVQEEVQIDGVKGRWGGLFGSSDSVLDSTVDSLTTISLENGEEIVLSWHDSKMWSTTQMPSETTVEVYRLPENAAETLAVYTADPDIQQLETELEFEEKQASLSILGELEPGTYAVVVNSQWSQMFYTRWGWGSYAFLAEVS